MTVVTQMTKVPEKIAKALLQFGFSAEQIDSFSDSSRLVQDLGIWGDDLDEFHDVLSEIYRTDKTIDAKFWPGEFSWMRQPLLWLPFVSHKKHLKCEPLSLIELDRMMSSQE